MRSLFLVSLLICAAVVAADGDVIKLTGMYCYHAVMLVDVGV